MKIYTAILILFISTSFTLAGEKTVLSLEDAIAMALKHNINIQNAVEGVEQARLRKKEAMASGLPSVAAFVQGTHNFAIASQPLKFPVPFGKLDDAGNPVQLPGNPNLQETTIVPVDVDIKFGQDNTAVYGLNVTQPLFEGRVIAAVRGAGSYQNMSKYGLEAARLRVIETTTVRFYTVMLAREALKVMEESLTFVKQNQTDTRILLNQGKATEFEIIRADVKVANQEAAVSNARKGLSLAKASLKRECGISTETDIEVIGTMEHPGEVHLDLDVYTQKLLADQPLLKQVTESIRLARENILLNKAEFMPSVYLTGSLQNIQPFNDGDYSAGNFEESSSIGISLSMPLFSGFGSTARVQKARSEHRKSVYLVEDTKEALLLELSNIVLSLKESQDRIKAGKKGVEQAHRGVEIAEELFNKGMMSQIDLMDANQGRNQAELGLLQAQFEYLVSRAALSRAINESPSESKENSL